MKPEHAHLYISVDWKQAAEALQWTMFSSCVRNLAIFVPFCVTVTESTSEMIDFHENGLIPIITNFCNALLNTATYLITTSKTKVSQLHDSHFTMSWCFLKVIGFGLGPWSTAAHLLITLTVSDHLNIKKSHLYSKCMKAWHFFTLTS